MSSEMFMLLSKVACQPVEVAILKELFLEVALYTLMY